MPPKDPYKVPKKMQPKYDEIVAMMDAVCQEHLNDEYADMCRKLCAALSRKRPSPLERGRTKIWAGAILYTIGRVNFLFDPSQDPHMRADELCAAMGVSKSTANAKASKIMKLFDIYQMDPDWTVPSMLDKNILAWMIMVDGLVVDARTLPRYIQEAAYEQGLIPYIPGEG